MECPQFWPLRPTPPKSVREPTEAPTGQRWCICNIKIGNPGRGQRPPPNTRRSKTVSANSQVTRAGSAHHVDTPNVECPQPWPPRPTPPKSVRGPTEVPPPPDNYVCNINIHHPSGSSKRRCPSPGILGSNITTDPGGEPFPPDQSPYSVRRRSVATQGEIITKPPGVDSARHPGNINGNDSSRLSA